MTTYAPTSPAYRLLCATNPTPAPTDGRLLDAAKAEDTPVWVLRCRERGIDPAEIERDRARFKAGLAWDYPSRRVA